LLLDSPKIVCIAREIPTPPFLTRGPRKSAYGISDGNQPSSIEILRLLRKEFPAQARHYL